ncbi:MAG: hypothetical protein IT580_12355, partial [Verrucomicrobiales bacterium]|nr:hypothetical protein [Verrucomicrobiales bacterium]
AIKQRWVSLPPGASGTLNTDGSFDYPAGTVWIKHFEMELRRGDPASRRRLETRFLVRNFDGVYGVTYRWNAEGTDATLVPNEGLDETLHLEVDGVAVDQTWRYPGRAECLRCHTAPTGFAAGFSLEQLNRNTTVGGVERPQLTWLQERGVLPPDLRAPHEIPALADPKDEHLPVPIRARSYLTSNCASCHRPGWLLDSGAHWNALFPTSLAETDLLDGRLCLPGNPADSRVYQMVERTLPGIVMPPLGSNVRDEFGLDLLARWIRTMPQAPWSYADLGRVAIPGSAALDRTALTLTLSAAGTGFGTEETLPGVLLRPWVGDGLFEATLRRLDAGRSNALAGFLVASAPEHAGRPEVSLAMDAGGFTHQFTTDRAGAIRHRTGTQFQGPVRFRAQRYGSSLTTFAVALEQGLGVQTVATLPAEAAWTAGLLTASGSVVQQAHASFDGWLWAEAQWTAPQPASILAYGTPVPLALTLTTEGIAVVRVEYFADEIPVSEATTSPFAAEWSHPPAGNHALTARVQLSDGRSFTTRPRAITVLPPPAVALFLSEDRTTFGDWIPRYGGLGNTLSNAVTQLAEDTQLSVLGGTYLPTPTTAFPAALPILPDGAQRSPGLWIGDPSLEVRVDRSTDESYRISLYLVDGSGLDEAVQISQLSDPLTGEILDRRSLSRFSTGAYLTWKVSGSLRISLVPLSPETGAATLAAVFLDRPRPGAGQARLTQPTAGTQVTAPTAIVLAATPVNPERPPVRVEFLVDDLVVAEATGPDFTALWDPALVGTHAIVARAYDEVNQSADSDAVQIEVAHVETRVEFLGTIPDAQGDWPHRVGSEGYLVAPWPASVAPNVQVALLTGEPYLWQNWRAGELVLDRRGALMPEGMREAACWTDPSALILHLNLLDGRPHVVTLYLVDWDTNLRRQRMEWLTPGSTNILHTQTVSEFFPGAHLVYLVQGRAWLRLVPETINAVLSGVFIDPSTSTFPTLHGISALAPSPSGVNLTWHSDHGRLYRLQYSDGLGSPWARFTEILSSEDGQYQFFDPTPPSAQSAGRFYRLEQISDGRGPLRLPER